MCLCASFLHVLHNLDIDHDADICNSFIQLLKNQHRTNGPTKSFQSVLAVYEALPEK